MRKRIVFTLLLGCLLNGCVQAPFNSSASAQRISMQEALIVVVAEDVRQTKGWPEGSYTINHLDRQGSFERFFVTNLPAASAFKERQVLRGGTIVLRTGGDGKSYTAWVNRKTKRVEKKTYVK